MSKPTRRGFIGTLAAIAAAPAALIADAGRRKSLVKDPEPLIKEPEVEDVAERHDCMVEFLGVSGESIATLPVVCVVTGEDVHRNLNFDFGTMTKDLGTLYSAKIYGLRFLPDGHEVNFTYRATPHKGDAIKMDFSLETQFS